MPATPTRLILAVALAASAIAAPVYADDAEVAGQYCDLVSTNDPTGLVSQDPNVRTGELHGGPVVVSDFVDDRSPGPAGNGVANPLTLVCAIQVNKATADFKTAEVVAYSAPSVGVAVLGPVSVSYTATPQDNVYVCSGIWYKSPDGTWVHTENDLDGVPENGAQCALVLSAGA